MKSIITLCALGLISIGLTADNVQAQCSRGGDSGSQPRGGFASGTGIDLQAGYSANQFAYQSALRQRQLQYAAYRQLAAQQTARNANVLQTRRYWADLKRRKARDAVAARIAARESEKTALQFRHVGFDTYDKLTKKVGEIDLTITRMICQLTNPT